MIGPGLGQVEQWYFWKVSFGDTVPELVRDQKPSDDEESIAVWAANPKKAVVRAKEAFYGYDAADFWDEHYFADNIDIEPAEDPFGRGTDKADVPKVNITQLKPAGAPPRAREEEPEEEPEMKGPQQQSFFDRQIEGAIDTVLEQEFLPEPDWEEKPEPDELEFGPEDVPKPLKLADPNDPKVRAAIDYFKKHGEPPPGAQKVHISPPQNVLRPRGSLEKESLSMHILDRLKVNFEHWTDLKYGDSLTPAKAISILKKNLAEEVEAAWGAFMDTAE